MSEKTAKYTDEKNTLILMALMKAHGIKKIIVSPGATNIRLVASVQNDDWFELYSCVDERSAAYMACGLAEESGESVALSCTGATASRNYVPALTEAYYRKLPVLAITSTQFTGYVGHYMPQITDRFNIQNDIALKSFQIPMARTAEDEWSCNTKINDALLELRHRGGGPVHINLTTDYSPRFTVKELPDERVINRIEYKDELPELHVQNIGIFVGSHKKFSNRLTEAIDCFCEIYNGVVLCDHTSNYRGKYRILPSLVCQQAEYGSPLKKMDVMIHIGEVSGSGNRFRPGQVWRVSPDGELRDTFSRLSYVFEMDELDFFEKYVAQAKPDRAESRYFLAWQEECSRFQEKIPEIPFSNAWVARQLSGRLPGESVLYLGILNTLRCWNFFETPESTYGFSNTGGFGIEGGLSALVGASLANSEKLHFAVIGDLSFFYDMNIAGNRHIGNNVRILVINNGLGQEFKNYNHNAAAFGNDADAFIAAAGHFGNKSPDLVKHYAEDLGFQYLCASTKEEFLTTADIFASEECNGKPILFEIFTDSEQENESLKILYHLETSGKSKLEKMARNAIGEQGKELAKKLLPDDVIRKLRG